MKLNKEQRLVLSNKIAREINEGRNKSNKPALPLIQKHLNPIAKKINDLALKYNEEAKRLNIRGYFGDLLNISPNKVHMYSPSNKNDENLYIGDKVKQISSTDIYSELTLGEIDTPDLEQLIKKIKDKFK